MPDEPDEVTQLLREEQEERERHRAWYRDWTPRMQNALKSNEFNPSGKLRAGLAALDDPAEVRRQRRGKDGDDGNGDD